MRQKRHLPNAHEILVTLYDRLTGKGASPINQCWCQKTRVIAVSCGINSASFSFVTINTSDRQTDGQTDRQN